ncbi:putative cellulase [Aspergillus venezuelensis]
MARLIIIFLLQSLCTLIASQYLDWSTYEANGVNLGGWLVQEYSQGAADEWGLCVNQGSVCGPVLERRYATWITTAVIDGLYEAAAWVKVPGSQLYTGNQVSFLDNIAKYAINKYAMHVIIDVHSLPGGVNGMAFGEAEGHFGLFSESYTIAPINEPVDNQDLSFFGTPLALSDTGAAWVLQYLVAVIEKVAAVNANIPIMFQGSFRGEEYWSPQIPSDANVVFDLHHYYFAGRGATSENITSYICSDAEASPGDGEIPVFIGEWSVQAEFDNTLAGRGRALNTGLYAFAAHTRGSAYWTAKFFGNNTVDGEGTQADYWNYLAFADQGMINPSEAMEECSGV